MKEAIMHRNLFSISTDNSIRAAITHMIPALRMGMAPESYAYERIMNATRRIDWTNECMNAAVGRSHINGEFTDPITGIPTAWGTCGGTQYLAKSINTFRAIDGRNAAFRMMAKTQFPIPGEIECDECGMYREYHLADEECSGCNMIYCENCEDSYSADDNWNSVIVDWRGNTEMWCQYCADRNAEECRGCGDHYSHNESSMDSCSECERTRCESCRDDWSYCENSGSICNRCECSCYECDGPGDDNDQSYNLKFNGNPANNLFLGFELELDCDRSAIEMSRDEFDGYVFDVPDCSVESGREFVSHPASFEYHEMMLPNYLKRLDQSGAWVSDITRRSFHTHVSRAAFDSAESEQTFMHLLYAHSDKWSAISRRETTYARIEGEAKSNPAIKMIDQRYRGKFEFVNVLHSATYEFRAPGASLDSNELLSGMAALAAAVEYSNEFPAEIFALDWQTFMVWISLHPTYRKYVDTIETLVEHNSVEKECDY